MRVLLKILQLIVIHNLVPKAERVSEDSLPEKIILWHLLRKELVNFEKLIIFNIWFRIIRIKKIKNKQIHHPFGQFITKSLKHFESSHLLG